MGNLAISHRFFLFMCVLIYLLIWKWQELQRSKANKIEQSFDRNEGSISEGKQTPDQTVKTPVRAKFEPKQPKIRRPGTGCITEINDYLYEGRFTPRVGGKRISTAT